MKKIEYLIIFILIISGLSCLVASTSLMVEQSVATYVSRFLKLCLMIGLPILVIGVIYFFLLKKRK